MPKFHRLRIAEKRRETADCVVLTLEVPLALQPLFRFVQGQHLVLRAWIDGEEVRRTYSICSGIREEKLRIAVKRQPHGRFSTWVHECLRAGDEIEVMPPRGRFFVPLVPDRKRLFVAFAAGSGITPILSILKSTLEEEPESHFLLFYGNRNTGSIIFREELEDLKNVYLPRFSLHHVLSAETSDVMELFSGRISPDKVRRWAGLLYEPAEVDYWFVCGPAPMIREITETLVGLGVVPERIRYEYFTTRGNRPRTTSQLAPSPETALPGCEVTVILDGHRRSFRMTRDDQTIVDAALEAGIEVPYSCKAGVCSTCRARVLEGRVDMAVNYALEDWELERGFVLTCQSRPLSEKVTLDYDES